MHDGIGTISIENILSMLSVYQHGGDWENACMAHITQYTVANPRLRYLRKRLK